MADFEIRTDTPSLAEKRAARRQRSTTWWIVAAAIAVCLVFVGLIIANQRHDAEPPPADNTASAPRAASSTLSEEAIAAASQIASAATGSPTIEDDGRTMWVSPTSGAPIDLGGLPPGCEMFVVLRPAALLATSEGTKLFAALGPRGEQGIAYIEKATGLELQDIDRLLIGFRAAGEFQLAATLVVTPRSGVAVPARSNPYRPRGSDGPFIVAAEGVLDEIKRLAGSSPPLRREIESLVATTDNERHLTLVATPTFLFNDGRTMWQGPLGGLRQAVFDLLPDSARGMAISMHAGDDFFAELRLVSTIDQRPQRFADQLVAKMATWPAMLEREIASVRATAYSASVVARLPAMLRVLNRYQRVGVDGQQSLVRVYLPPTAGHNLLMASELLLAERAASNLQVGQQAATATSKSLEERLQQRVSVSFARDTLETAVQLLADAIGASAVILGGDLQLEGITKNQSFALDEQEKPAADILVTILRRANPDKTASGPADPKQKLVYTLGRDASSGAPTIFITTRVQAEKRGDPLPDVFTN